MLTLGIDTSNYATSLAVFDTDTASVVCDLKRFLPVKEGRLGLRQSDAVFHHTAALPALLHELNKKCAIASVKAVGVSEKPRPAEGSYMPCFLPGLTVAEAVSLSLKVPLIKTTHQQGHIMAALYACETPQLFHTDTLVFHVSGGTTELLLCNGGTILEKIGESTDLYAGQAVDRIGTRLGFPFPCGTYLSELAARCNEPVLPKASLKGCDCSFSGLENQCITLLERNYPAETVARYCLDCIAKTIAGMLMAARNRYPGLPAVCAGGVMSSCIIRREVEKLCEKVYFVPGRFASDNAIGVAILAAGGASLA